MSDNKSIKDYRDRSRINKSQPYEVFYWTNKWKVSRRQLLAAMNAISNTSVKKVMAYLRKKRKGIFAKT